MARSENFRKECNLEKEEDFSLGYALGSIMKDFAIYYLGKHGKFGVEVITQSSEILTKRIREIKEAVFKCG
ncbi:MAG: hypothetical protein IIA82_11350 [Thaumarchaeota archaeon]|nr:hypothetical protein [Nitrososphaerota archaeon]